MAIGQQMFIERVFQSLQVKYAINNRLQTVEKPLS
jgi:hypothetical protein